jgi:HSP20 family protein
MTELTLWMNEEMNKLRRDMERLFSRYRSDFGIGLLPWESEAGPSFDLSETKDRLVLRVDLPGVDPKDLEISVSGDRLTLKGRRQAETVKDTGRYHTVERRFGSFSRTLNIPCKVKMDDIQATLKDGTLEIVMPKCGPEEPKGIKIEVDED